MNPTGHTASTLVKGLFPSRRATGLAPATAGRRATPLARAASRWKGRLRTLGIEIDGWLRARAEPLPEAGILSRQERVLQRIVHRNRRTTFGLQHGFGTIGGFKDYARRVPIMDDDGLLRWLRYRAEQDPRALTPAPRSWREAAALPLTSSNDAPASTRAELARLHRLCPTAFTGDVIITECAQARAWADAGRLPRAALALPEACWEVADPGLRDMLMLRLALARDNVTCLAGLGAEALRRWMHSLETHHRFLLKDLRQGGFFLSHQLPAGLQARLAPALRPQPARAQALAHQRRLSGPLRPAHLWPGLVLWITPPAAALECLLRDELPACVRVVERHFETDPLRRAVGQAVDGGACLPLTDSLYYEFAPRAAWEAGERTTLPLQQLREGMDYYLIISAEQGLYRYFTADVLTVTGWRDGLPLFRFVSQAPQARPAFSGSALSQTGEAHPYGRRAA